MSFINKSKGHKYSDIYEEGCKTRKYAQIVSIEFSLKSLQQLSMNGNKKNKLRFNRKSMRPFTCETK